MLHLLLTALLFVQVHARPIQEDKEGKDWSDRRYVDVHQISLMYSCVFTALEEDWFTRAMEYMKSNPETLEGGAIPSVF